MDAAKQSGQIKGQGDRPLSAWAVIGPWRAAVAYFKQHAKAIGAYVDSAGTRVSQAGATKLPAPPAGAAARARRGSGALAWSGEVLLASRLQPPAWWRW